MSCCPTCGLEKPERAQRGDLLVVDSPPEAYWRGRRLQIGVMEAKTLMPLAAQGMASHLGLTINALGEESGPETVKTRICQLRRKLVAQGVTLRIVARPGWGYVLEDD